MGDIHLHVLAVGLVTTVMRSVSAEKVRPVDWWVRAQSALKTASSMSRNFPQMISIMGRKLQIDAFTKESAVALMEIANSLPDVEFESFRYLCERDGLFIVAEAQAQKAMNAERWTDEEDRISSNESKNGSDKKRGHK
jgi:hypothetical protein